MTQTSQTLTWEGYLTAELPESWSASEEEGVITIYDENGVGALQASFIRTPAVVAFDDIDNAAHGFMKQLGLAPSHRVSVSNVANTKAVYFEGVVGDNYWRVWHFGKERRMCCLSYTCSVDDQGVEDETVDGIVSHLKLD
jgi:hypothetical protein